MDTKNLLNSILLVTSLCLLSLSASSESEDERKPINLNNHFLSRFNPQFDVSAHSSNLMGEQYDIASGLVTFSRVDAKLPGNSKLEVAYRTSYQIDKPDILGWVEDIPRIEFDLLKDNYPSAWGDGQQKYCSGNQVLPVLLTTYISKVSDKRITVRLSGDRYSPGLKVIVPGKTNSKLLYNNGVLKEAKTKYVTKDSWRISCYTVSNSRQEGFKAQAPDGTTYYFSKDITKNHQLNNKTDKIILPHKKIYYKRKRNLLVSRIEDKFGNYVIYQYDADGNIKTISANDGRRINVTHSKAIKTVTAGTRTWTYQKDATGNYIVTEPNNKTWVYDLFQVKGFRPDNEPDCDYPYDIPSTDNKMSVKHPDGTVGTFIFAFTGHGRVNYLRSFLKPTYDYDVIPTKYCSLNYDLIEKQLRLTDDSQLTWLYDYSDNEGAYRNTTHITKYHKLEGTFPRNIDAVKYKSTTVTHPDNSKIIYYVNRDSLDWRENNIEAVEYKDTAGNVVKEKQTVLGAGLYKGQSVTHDFYNVSAGRVFIRTVKETITQRSNTYTQEFEEFNDYDRYQKKISTNSFSDKKKYQTFTFKNDFRHWNLNNLATYSVSEEDANYTLVSKIDYKLFSSSNAYVNVLLPEHYYTYGENRQTNKSYYADGNIFRIEVNKTRTTGSGKRFVEYSNYMRGIPQTEKKPSRELATDISAYREVDSNGWITSITDYNNTKTKYKYDSLGRILSVDLPNDDIRKINWLDTLYSWSEVLGSPVRKVERCVLNSAGTACADSVKLTVTENYDSMLRLKQLKEDDGTNVRFQNATYNYYNKPLFKSFKSIDEDEKKGLTTTYDTLGALETATTSGMGSITYDYLSDNRIKVTNGEGNATTITYLAYGTPSYTAVTKIELSDDVNVTTVMDIDVFGLTQSITQSGRTANNTAISQTETNIFNETKQLCLKIRKDVGTTAYGYNNLGEVDWMAQGVSYNTTTPTCITKPSIAISYHLDNLGNIAKIDYPSGNHDVTYKRDNNGNLLSLTTGDVKHSYYYNNQNLLEAEILAIGSEKTLTLDYGYDVMAHHSYITYPNGSKVFNTSNAFGQATEIKTGNVKLAYDAKYYPNGQIKSFTYGNGIIHTTEINKYSQLPASITDIKGTNEIISLAYTHDNNGNINSIYDNQNPAYNITKLTYDSLDRLKTTTGGSDIGDSAINYDSLGNITSYNSKNSSLHYQYNHSNNQLISVTGSGEQSTTYTSIKYDNRGNIISNSIRSFQYNLANQMTSSGSNSYLYDGHNRRVKQTDSNGVSYSMYSQGGTLLYREVDVVNGKGDGINYLYLGKKLVAKRMDNIKGNSSRQHYKPFGDSVETTKKDDIGFTGHKFDKDLGLSYMQARYYDPVIGRFYSNDPVGYTAANPVMSFNRYMYVNNNPYKYNDPDGEFLNFAIGAAVGFISEVIVQTVIEGRSIGNLDTGRLGQSTVIGALSGGVGGAAGKLAGKVIGAMTKPASGMANGASRIITGAAQGSVSGATGSATHSAATQFANTGSVDMGQVGDAAVLGAVTGMAGGGVAGKVRANAAQKTLGNPKAQTMFTDTQPGARAGAIAGNAAGAASGVGKATNAACQREGSSC